MRKAVFYSDDERLPVLVGWTTGATWNGYAVAWFERAAVETLIDAWRISDDTPGVWAGFEENSTAFFDYAPPPAIAARGPSRIRVHEKPGRPSLWGFEEWCFNEVPPTARYIAGKGGIEGAAEGDPIELLSFLEANREMPIEEQRAIVALQPGESYTGGGGASPEWTIQRVDDAPGEVQS